MPVTVENQPVDMGVEASQGLQAAKGLRSMPASRNSWLRST